MNTADYYEGRAIHYGEGDGNDRALAQVMATLALAAVTREAAAATLPDVGAFSGSIAVPEAVRARLNTRCGEWPMHPHADAALRRCGECDGCKAHRWVGVQPWEVARDGT